MARATSQTERDLSKCIELQRQFDSLEADLKKQESAAATITQEQERLVTLIPNGHKEQANAWRKDLADAERELREIKRSKIPNIKAQLSEVGNSLHEALGSLQYEWTDASGEGVRE